MHASAINGIALDGACKLLATGSDDKTIRLWATPVVTSSDFKLTDTLRPQIRSANEGRVTAVAVSRDGKLLATALSASTDEPSRIQVIDLTALQIVVNIAVNRPRVHGLSFSADGQSLAGVLAGNGGLRVWRSSDGVLLASDRAYRHGARDVAFDREGRVFTVAFDGFIRRYSPDFKLDKKVKARSGLKPASLALHPSQRSIAIGYADGIQIDIIRTSDLENAFTVVGDGRGTGTLAEVAWSSNGRHLYAGGSYRIDNRAVIQVTDRFGRGTTRLVKTDLSTISSMRFCGKKLYVGTHGPEIGTFDKDLQLRNYKKAAKIDMKELLCSELSLTVDGRVVMLPLPIRDYRHSVFDLRRTKLLEPAQMKHAERLRRLASANNKSRCSTMRGSLQIKSVPRAKAESRNRQSVAFGSAISLWAEDASGKTVWRRAVASAVVGLNVSINNRLVIAAHEDGTVRWYRLKDGQELLALFVSASLRNWILWTPKGFYTASLAGEGLVGWHVNRGDSRFANFVAASDLRGTLNRPDIIDRVVDSLDEDPVARSRETVGDLSVSDQLNKNPRPAVTILSPKNGRAFYGRQVKLRYRVDGPPGAQYRVQVYVNGRLQRDSLGEKGFVPVAATDAVRTIPLRLPARDVHISLTVASEDGGAALSRRISLTWAGHRREEPVQRNLYALLIGVSDYQSERIKDLRWAHKDAEDFAATLRKQQGRIYKNVEVTLLRDQQADRISIVTALRKLEQQAGKEDVAVVFLSGHGATDERRKYYFLPHDVQLNEQLKIPFPNVRTTVSSDLIRESLRRFESHVFFFFDSCHAGWGSGIRFKSSFSGNGNQDLYRVINELSFAKPSVFVMASSDGRELSIEKDEWRNGAFTKALNEGFEGLADNTPTDGYLSFDELFSFVARRVEDLTDGNQHPVRQIPDAVGDPRFFVAAAKAPPARSSSPSRN